MPLHRQRFLQLTTYAVGSFLLIYMVHRYFQPSSMAFLSQLGFEILGVQNGSSGRHGSMDNVTVPSSVVSAPSTIANILTSLRTSDAMTSIQTWLQLLSSGSTVRNSSPSSNATTPTPRLSFSATTPMATTTLMAPTPGVTKKLLCHSFTGRLGNELFQFASTLGLALSMHRLPVFVGGFGLESMLKRSPKYPNHQGEMEKRCREAKSVSEASANKFDERLTKLDPNFDYWVNIYLQSWRYFERHKKEVKAALTFNDDIMRQALDVLQGIRKDHANATLIGVHVRRGDFESDRNKGLGYPMATPEFINASTKHFLRLFTDSVFVVASENMQWCKENFHKDLKAVFLGAHSPAVDMMILAHTDHIITTFGSYSWWAGYFNKGLTIYMKDYIKPNTYVAHQFDLKREDYMYPGWIPI